VLDSECSLPGLAPRPFRILLAPTLGKRCGAAIILAPKFLDLLSQAYVWYRVAAAAVAHPENHTQLLPPWLFRYPVVGIFMELFRPTHYPFSPWLSLAVQCADALALCGCLALMTAAVLDLRRRPWDVEQWAILAFLTLVLATSAPGFWSNVYGYARPFSTLMFLATLRLLRRRAAWALAPLLLIALRVGIQMAPQAARIMRAVFYN
jgi:hypothetical protein